MNKMTIYELAIKTFGEKRQLMVVAEEYAELTQQLLKAKNSRLDFNALLGEVADAIIVTEQLKVVIGELPLSDIWQVNNQTFDATTNQLIKFMSEVTLWVLFDNKSPQYLEKVSLKSTLPFVVANIDAILSSLSAYLGHERINEIIVFKLNNIKKMLNGKETV